MASNGANVASPPVVASRQVHPRAAPWPRLGRGDAPSAHRVELDEAHGRDPVPGIVSSAIFPPTTGTA
jgi:hypothetical protein